MNDWLFLTESEIPKEIRNRLKNKDSTELSQEIGLKAILYKQL